MRRIRVVFFDLSVCPTWLSSVFRTYAIRSRSHDRTNEIQRNNNIIYHSIHIHTHGVNGYFVMDVERIGLWRYDGFWTGRQRNDRKNGGGRRSGSEVCARRSPNLRRTSPNGEPHSASRGVIKFKALLVKRIFSTSYFVSAKNALPLEHAVIKLMRVSYYGQPYVWWESIKLSRRETLPSGNSKTLETVSSLHLLLSYS